LRNGPFSFDRLINEDARIASRTGVSGAAASTGRTAALGRAENRCAAAADVRLATTISNGRADRF